ncbi:MAG: hypothetical protein ACI4PF_01090 [Christensenellales bacterium]
MPVALQYGMTPQQFWYDDPKLIKAYEKAYQSKIYMESWLYGAYVDKALHDFGDIYLRFKGQPNKEMRYPDKPIDVFEKPKEKITKENLEEKFREQMTATTSWLRDRFKK